MWWLPHEFAHESVGADYFVDVTSAVNIITTTNSSSIKNTIDGPEITATTKTVHYPSIGSADFWPGESTINVHICRS